MDLLVLSGEFEVEGDPHTYKRGEVFDPGPGHEDNVQEWVRRGWVRVVEDEA